MKRNTSRVVLVASIALVVGALLATGCKKPNQEQQQPEPPKTAADSVRAETNFNAIDDVADEAIAAATTEEEKNTITKTATEVKETFQTITVYTPIAEKEASATDEVLYLNTDLIKARATRQDDEVKRVYEIFRPNTLLSYPYQLWVNGKPVREGCFYLVRSEGERDTILSVIKNVRTLYLAGDVYTDEEEKAKEELRGIARKAQETGDGLFGPRVMTDGVIYAVINTLKARPDGWIQQYYDEWFPRELLKLEMLYKSMPLNTIMINEEMERDYENHQPVPWSTRADGGMMDAGSFDAGYRYIRHRLGIP